MNMIRCAALSSLALLTGCASYNGIVLPVEAGVFEVTTSGMTRKAALQNADSDAQMACKKETGNPSYTLLESNTDFTGIAIDRGDGGKTQAVVAGAIEKTAAIVTVDNHEVVMKFRCDGVK